MSPPSGRGNLKRKLCDAVEEVQDSNGSKFRCLIDIDSDRKCIYVQEKSFNAYNFKRHINCSHPEVAKRMDILIEAKEPGSSNAPGTVSVKQKSQKVTVDTTRGNVLLGTLQMVTEHNLPIRYPEWGGSKLLLEPLWVACNLKITRNTLPNLVHRAAEIMRKVMSAKFEKKAVNLKVDAATRHGKSIFGINSTIVDNDGVVQIMHLAAHEMPERQTKENLQRVIDEEIKVFGIDYKQLLAITSDNGQNILAAVRFLKSLMGDALEGSLGSILRKEYSLIVNSCTSDDPDTSEPTETNPQEEEEDVPESELLMIPENDDFVEEPTNDNVNDNTQLEDDQDDQIINVDIMESVRCGAHTAQLAVWDVLREYKTRLSNINKKCLRMHLKSNRQLFTFHKTALPPKTCETRWNVWYLLMRYLKELEGTPFLSLIQNNDPEIDFSRQWKFINQFCEAFEPVFLLTLKCQKDHVPISQFYADWLTCMAQIHAASTKNNNTLAKKLLKAMDKRSKTLRNSMPFKACLYMDPRFNFIGSNRLTADEKNEIQKYLLALHIRLNDIEGLNDEKCDDRDDNETIPDDFVEEYLTCFFQEETTSNLNSSNGADTDSLMAEIMKLETRPKVSITVSRGVSIPMPSTSSQDPSTTTKLQTSEPFDIIKYWKQRKISSPRLYRLAMALLSIPSTQVTVERLFSQLRLVLTDSRTKLSDTMIKDILLLKMNKHLWPEVIEILLSEL